MKTNTRKLTLNSILLAIGLLLHQLTPALGFPIQPDMALAMMFVIMIMNKDDYKTCLVAGIITGVFTALTTKFPGGQIPNIIDKTITVNVVFVIMYIVYRLPYIKSMADKKKNLTVAALILPIGTLVSGTAFLYSAKLIVGLPGPFSALFAVAVLPATVINLLAGLFLFKVVQMTVSRTVSA